MDSPLCSSRSVTEKNNIKIKAYISFVIRFIFKLACKALGYMWHFFFKAKHALVCSQHSISLLFPNI